MDGKTELLCYLLVGQIMVPAQQEDLLLLRWQALDGFFYFGCRFLIMCSLCVELIFIWQILFPLILLLPERGHLLQHIIRSVPCHHKKIGIEIVDAGKRFAGKPDLQKGVLHNFLGDIAGAGEAEYIMRQLVMITVKQLLKSLLIAG